MIAAQVLQSALDPAGPQAAYIGRLWWLMFWVCTAVFVVTMAFVALAIVRARGRAREGARMQPDDEVEARTHPVLTTAVVIGVVGTTAILFVFLVAAVWTGRAVASLGAESAVSIDVRGHQWWWEVEYEDAVPSQRFKTANEIHIPVGRPVVLKLESTDVIHSLWIPNLNGKRDLIPGYTNAFWIQADRPGIYRGQCAEFCGFQHAKMAMYVVAESDSDFHKWEDDQRKSAVTPTTDDERRGRDVFLKATCTQCHTIRGTIAGATRGPDLTHLATRATIGAGTLPNSPGHLAGWITDSQSIKPGNHMPPNSVRGDELQALLTYLVSLK